MTEFRWHHVLTMSRAGETTEFVGRLDDGTHSGGQCVAAARRESSGAWIGLIISPDREVMDVEIAAGVGPALARGEFERALREDARWGQQ
jgi:hypothetical protein